MSKTLRQPAAEWTRSTFDAAERGFNAGGGGAVLGAGDPATDAGGADEARTWPTTRHLRVMCGRQGPRDIQRPFASCLRRDARTTR